VIGVDEAGRGCLAGPVVAAAVILNSESGLRAFTDSKFLSEARREELFSKIMSVHFVGVGFATASEVDEINVLQASFLAMKRAIQALGVANGHIVVDGHMKIPERHLDARGFEQTALIKGDLRCKPVSAASIIAKVTRDRHMKELAKEFPNYGFELHKGYGTVYHREKIEEFGICREHRRTFRGPTLDAWLEVGDAGVELALEEELVD
jgi:ribonuclease HII